MLRRRLLPLLLILAIFSVAACSSPGEEAKKPVEQMYKAMATRDMNAYMDTILPENRSRPNPLSLLSILGALVPDLGIGDFNLDLGGLLGNIAQVSIQDLKLTVEEERDGYVLVRAEGRMRYPGLFFETAFCDEHDVRQVEGKWYVDVFAPEREARLQAILGSLQQELGALATAAPSLTGNLEIDLLLTLRQFSEGAGVALDLCAPAR